MSTETFSGLTPGRAFWASIGIFVLAIIAVALLWALVGAWVGLIVLLAAFCALLGINIYALRFYRRETGQIE